MSKKGTDEQFQRILQELTSNLRRYENGEIKHIQWCDQQQRVLEAHGWSRTEFDREVNIRLGNVAPQSEKEAPTPKKKRKVK